MEEKQGIVKSKGAASPPASAWVRFLRGYGPIPADTNLFDEHITSALKRTKFKPIELSSPRFEEMLWRIRAGVPGSILITGMAGDGKTYHCRRLWLELGGVEKDWTDMPSAAKALALPDGREVIFIKDLSELNDPKESEEILGALEQSTLGGDDSIVLVLAANHGQILERLRELGEAQGRLHPLLKPIQDVFLLAGPGIERLGIFDLSRSVRRQSFEEVLRVVAEHPEWSRCQGCAFDAGGRVCPIAENRRRALGQQDGGRFSRRLGDLIELARLGGSHLPVRDLLALAANLLLGHPDAKEGLLSCTEVSRIQEAGSVERGSLYSNGFGANLPPRRALSRPVFRALNAFGVGQETFNAADGLLVYGADDARLRPAFERMVGADSVYGATPLFLAAQRRYLEGAEDARGETGAADFLDRLVEQRRRLFFTLPEDEKDYPFWELTAFRFAGDYLALLATLDKKLPVAEPVRERLARGLNRGMTGLLLENSDRIFIATSGGFTQSKISVLCKFEAPGRLRAGIGMSIRRDSVAPWPRLNVALAPGADRSVTFVLTPVRFEFLCRIAEGALPGSFSNECLEDLLAFKAKLLRKAELYFRDAPQTQEDSDAADSLEEGSTLQLDFIEIEPNGHGYSRPITMRLGA